MRQIDQSPDIPMILVAACSLDGSVNLDQCTLPHLDRVVREGAVGLLALRDATSKGAGIQSKVRP
jgi:hypothetical protein